MKDKERTGERGMGKGERVKANTIALSPFVFFLDWSRIFNLVRLINQTIQ